MTVCERKGYGYFMKKRIKPYIVSVLIALAVGGLSALLTKNNMDIYNQIQKPTPAPPMLVFPIVWSILFALMGISAAIVYTGEGREKTTGALVLYALQLAVNFFWSIIFFNMRAFLFAFLWLVLLWALILLMIIAFARIKPLAAWLQIPYLLWVSFAGYLTLMVYMLN